MRLDDRPCSSRMRLLKFRLVKCDLHRPPRYCIVADPQSRFSQSATGRVDFPGVLMLRLCAPERLTADMKLAQFPPSRSLIGIAPHDRVALATGACPVIAEFPERLRAAGQRDSRQLFFH